MRFVAPMIDDGSTALSVLMKMKASTSADAAASATSRVPRTLVQTVDATFDSDSGTCFCAAAWKTTCGRSRSKTRVHGAGVGDVADHRDDLDVGEAAAQLLVDVEQRRLGALEQHEPSDPERGDLAAQLRADAAAGAGHEHRPAADERPHRLLGDGDRLAPQEVLDPDRADAVDRDGLVEQLVDGGERSDGDAGRLAQGDDAAAADRRRCAAWRR